MITVFQGETGGNILFQYDTNAVTASSGYLDLISKNRITYRFDGSVASGYLFIAKLGLSSLPYGEYTALPQLLDSELRVYFITIEDLQIVEVPSFFDNAVLYSGSSILVRLRALEQFVDQFYVGSGGVSTVVDNLQGRPLSAQAPTSGQGLIWQSTQWVPADITADAYFRYVQMVPSTEWTVPHNLNKNPSVTIIDSSGDEVFGEVEYTTANSLKITFSSPVSGEVECN